MAEPLTDTSHLPPDPVAPPPPSLTLALPRWAPFMPWIVLWLLELPSYSWLWGFQLSRFGVLGILLPLVVYLALGAFVLLLAWIFEPIFMARRRPAQHQLLPGGWAFCWAGMWAWGVCAIATPLFLWLSPNSHPGGWAAWVATIGGALIGLGIAQGLLLGLRRPVPHTEGPALTPVRRANRLLWSTSAFVGLLALGHSWGQIAPPRPGEPKPPNVLLVTLDTVNLARVSTYGYELDTMPTLTRLATEGAKFTQAYAHVPLTLPSHGTIFTGLHPQGFGVYENQRPMPFKVVTLAEQFRANGYFTAGVPASRVMRELYHIHQGFDRWPERSAEHGLKSLQWVRLFPLRLIRIVWGSPLDLAHLVDDAVYTNARTLEAVRYARHRPWFIWSHYYDPHAPYTLPKGDREAYYLESPVTPDFDPDNLGRISQLMNISYEGLRPLLGACYMEEHKIHPLELAASEVEDLKRMYDAQLKYTDAHLGQLLEDLEALGQLENTLVVVAADHGEALFDRGYFGHNFFLHQDEVHVPLIIWWPGKVPQSTIDVPMGLSDLYPTILHLAKLPPPQHWLNFPEILRGNDLTSWLADPASAESFGPVYLQQFTFSRAQIMPDGQKLIFQANKEAVPRSVNPYHGAMWFWHELGTDPYERVNLAAPSPEALPESQFRFFTQLQGALDQSARGIEGSSVMDLNYQGYLELAIDDAERAALESLGYITPQGPALVRPDSECEQPITRTPAREAELATESEAE